MIRLVVELPDEIHYDLRIKAAKENKTIKEAVTELLLKWLKEKAVKKGG